eukprot:3427085-Prorocentrum_lima.AAC.1
MGRVLDDVGGKNPLKEERKLCRGVGHGVGNIFRKKSDEVHPDDIAEDERSNFEEATQEETE